MMWGGGGWWVFGAVVMVVCIYMMVRMMGHGGSAHGDHSGADHHESMSSAGEILAARFARGEISEEEFEQRKRVLEGSSH
jgi:putative membrane protein